MCEASQKVTITDNIKQDEKLLVINSEVLDVRVIFFLEA